MQRLASPKATTSVRTAAAYAPPLTPSTSMDHLSPPAGPAGFTVQPTLMAHQPQQQTLQAAEGFPPASSSLLVKTVEEQQRWYLLAHHCDHCNAPAGACATHGKLCTFGKRSFAHARACKRANCSMPNCAHLKLLINHKRTCTGPKVAACPICAPVTAYIARKRKSAEFEASSGALDRQQLAAGGYATMQAAADAAAMPPPSHGSSRLFAAARHALQRVGVNQRAAPGPMFAAPELPLQLQQFQRAAM